jgi:outer membrane protein assembly factor BamA
MPNIDSLDIAGASAVDTERLEEGLATRESPRFLLTTGVFQDYEVLDVALLERDLERVERYFRARGYYEAKVSAARVIWLDANTVRVELVVHEGLPVRIPEAMGQSALAVQLQGLEQVTDPATVASLIAASPRPGAVFDEGDYERAKGEMQRLLADNGYAFASVKGRAEVDIARREARLAFQIEPGRPAVFGDITIAGLVQVPEDKLRQSLLIASGDPYSASALEDARRALVNLGAFAQVRVEADTQNPQSGRVPVKFSVLETAPRALRLGGGARLDALELSLNLTASWEHRNFFGGLRHFAIEARPGVVLFPTRMADFPDVRAPSRGLFKGALEARFVQPSFLEGRTKGLASSSVKVEPLLYSDSQPEEPLLGFLEIGARLGLERPFFDHRLFLTPSMNWQAALPVDYRDIAVGELSPPVQNREIDNLFIAYPELLARFDIRDDPLDPKNGFLLTNSLQVAVPALGGKVSDLRIRPEARVYFTKTDLTLAVRVATGLLFPRNYAATRAGELPSIDDQQRLLFRGFFSGGPFSNRGYAYQGVGRHVSFPLSADRGVRCNETLAMAEPDQRCLRPLGGLTLWEASLELRFPLGFLAPLGAVLFLDSSDVSSGRAEYTFSEPHLAPGLGLRYPTPVGPIRLDLGFRLLEFLGEEQVEGVPPNIFGAPLTLHLAVGQAF